MEMIDIFNHLVETNDIYKACEEWKENNCTGLCYALLDKTNLDDIDKQNLMFVIKILQFIYNNSDTEPPVSDSVFDSLYELNRKVNLTEVVGSINPQGKLIVQHNYPDLRGTLDKIHFYYDKDKGSEKNKKSMEYWFNQLFKVLRADSLNPLRNPELKLNILLMPKFDGVSVIIETDENGVCERALTRGDTELNEAVDLSNIFKGINFSRIMKENGIVIGRCGIKLEVVMKQDAFEEYCEKYGKFNNTRAAVVSALNNSENGAEILKYLTMMPLRIQEDESREIHCIYDYSISVDMTFMDFSIDRFKPIVDDIVKCMELDKIPIDGIVFVILNESIQDIMGRKDAINKYEFAYKFPTNRFRTKVNGITWSIGNLGNITPVADLEPITCFGNRVDSATLSSIDKFNSLGLREGDEVIITYDIVPYLIKDDTCESSGGKKFKIPKKCPLCKEETVIEGAFLKCTNKHCPSVTVGKVLNFCDKMRIPYLNTETVNKFYNIGILNDIKDIYLLENYRVKISELPGFGVKSFQNIIDGINSRRKCKASDMLGSIGIAGIAQSTFKKILEKYSLDDLIKICNGFDEETLISIEGIASKKASAIIEGINENIETIDFLRKQLQLENPISTNMTVSFTGFRNKEFAEFLEEKGIEFSDSFKKNVSLLVVKNLKDEMKLPEGSRSKKVQKAIDRNIRLVDMFDYAKEVGYNGLL